MAIRDFVSSGSIFILGSPAIYSVAAGDHVGLSDAVATIFRVAGTFSKLLVRFSTNSKSTTTTFQSRKNGVAANMLISIPAGVTGDFEDTTNSDTIVSGDTYTARLVPGADGSMIINLHQVSFEAATSSVVYYGGTSSFGGISGVQYLGALSLINFNATEANAQVRVPHSGTLKNLRLHVGPNDDASAETFTTRINGAPGNISISVPATTTGFFEDTTNTDAIAANDLVNLHFTGTGTGPLGAIGYNLNFVNVQLDGSTSIALVGGLVSGGTLSTGLTRYVSIFGFEHDTAEATAQFVLRSYKTVSKMWFKVLTNATTGASTLTFRKNSADTSITASIPTATTGTFTDDSHTVDLAPTDRVDFQLINGGGGSLVWAALSALMTDRTVTLPGQLGFHPLNMV